MGADFVLSGSAAGAVQAVSAVNKQIDESEKKADKASAATKRLEEAAKRLAAQVDPQAKYNQQMERLNELAQKGGLSIRHAELAATRYKQELDDVANAGNRAFGSRALSDIASVATGVLGISKALQFAVAGFQAFESERQAAAQRVVQSLQDFGELAQISSDERSFNRQLALGRDIIKRGIVSPENEGQAATIAFALDSAGLSEADKATILDIGQAKYVSAGSLASFGGAIGQVQKALSPEETGNALAIANKAVAAAKPTKARAQELAESVAKVAAVAKPLGLTDEEVFAAMSRVTEVFGTAAEAETRVRALIGQVDKKGFDRASLAESLSAINAAVAGGKSARDVLGENQEALAAFNVLGDVDAFRSRLQEVDSSQRTNPLALQLQLLERDPQLRAAKRRAEAEGRKAVTTDAFLSEAENLRRAAFADIEDRKRRAAPGVLTEVDIAFERAGASIPLFGDPESFLKATQNVDRVRVEDPQLRKDIADYLKRSAEAAEKAAENLESLNSKRNAALTIRGE